jgi:hypothetical protein
MGVLFRNNQVVEEKKVEAKSEINEKDGYTRVNDIIGSLDSKDLQRGFILSEIFEKPLSRRRRKRL